MISDPSQQYAVKIIDKQLMKQHSEFVERELGILKGLDHPNIVRFYEVYEDENSFYLVMEYCSGGDIVDKLAKFTKLEEKEVAQIMYQAFSAVVHLHKIGIAHRDLKPENFLFKSQEPDSEIKLIDFGLSRYFGDRPEVKLHTTVGTPVYCAPELLRGKYDERCDNWSLGVMMYLLLCGYPPFDGEAPEEIYSMILEGTYTMATSDWRNISSLAKDLIFKLLQKDPENRITASEALNHEWFKKMLNPDPVCTSPKVATLLKTPRSNKKLENEVLQLMIKYMPENEIKEFKETFRFFDKDNSGYISIQELKTSMSELGQNITDAEIEQLLKSVTAGKGRKSIKFSEFIVAAMDKNYLTIERLWQVFQHLDTDKTNDISFDDIKRILTRAGKNYSDEEINEMIREVDSDHDGKLSFKDFVQMMKGQSEPITPEEIKIMANC